MSSPETHNLARHMQHLSLSMLGHAIHHSIFSDVENPYYDAIGVLHAAQVAEIVLKACIAAEHPLLIFAKIPRPERERQDLTLEDLMKRGRTLQYADLPDVLWAATGRRVPSLDVYREFGKLRNTVQHLLVPEDNLSGRALEFLIDVVDPLIQDFGATKIFRHLQVDENEYFVEALDRHDIVYKGWVPLGRGALDTKHPLWLFSRWEHSVTKERIWVDEHLRDQVRILRSVDYEGHLKTATAPTEWIHDWREIFPSTRTRQ